MPFTVTNSLLLLTERSALAGSLWQFNASPITIQPEMSSFFINSGTAGISLLFASTVLCARGSPNSPICALTMCKGLSYFFIFPVERISFPSMAMVNGFFLFFFVLSSFSSFAARCGTRELTHCVIHLIKRFRCYHGKQAQQPPITRYSVDAKCF